MRAVLGNIPEMRVLTGAELDEAIDVALERGQQGSRDAALAEIAKTIAKASDRYWATVYVMIIALADGKEDWREVKFLEDLRGVFKLTETQMDAAMKTASQFPAVELGGVAPA